MPADQTLVPLDLDCPRQRQEFEVQRTQRSLARPFPMGERELVKGFPRPRVRYRSWEDSKAGRDTWVNLPVPWITDVLDAQANHWASLDDRAVEISALAGHRMCQLCGEETQGYRIYARAGGQAGCSSGPGMHARCALIALASCPHLKQQSKLCTLMFDIVRGNEHGIEDNPWTNNIQLKAFHLKPGAFIGLTTSEVKALALEETLSAADAASGAPT